jgi:hypothetical protein
MHPGLLDPFGACARSIAFAAIACRFGVAETAGSNRFSGRRYSGAGSR